MSSGVHQQNTKRLLVLFCYGTRPDQYLNVHVNIYIFFFLHPPADGFVYIRVLHLTVCCDCQQQQWKNQLQTYANVQRHLSCAAHSTTSFWIDIHQPTSQLRTRCTLLLRPLGRKYNISLDSDMINKRALHSWPEWYIVHAMDTRPNPDRTPNGCKVSYWR